VFSKQNVIRQFPVTRILCLPSNYTRDIQDFASVNEVYQNFFDSIRPARAAVAVAGLPKGAAVEIEAIAMAEAKVEKK